MILIERPELLYLFIVVPLLIIIHFLATYNFKRKSFKFANFETIKRLTEEKRLISRQIVQLLIRVVAISVLIFAISGPTWQYESEGYVDTVVFAVDVSGSMIAKDIEPNRLDAAKEEILGVISNFSEAGIVSFTTIPYLEERVTSDETALTEAINGLNVRKTSGTSIGSAISFSTSLLQDKNNAAIIVISDGQENLLSGEELMDVSKNVRNMGIKIFSIGIGSLEGAAIGDETVGRSVVNSQVLDAISDRSIVAESKEGLKGAMDEILERGEINRKIELTTYLIVLAFFLLLLEWYIITYVLRLFP